MITCDYKGLVKLGLAAAVALFPTILSVFVVPNYHVLRDSQLASIRDVSHEVLLPITLFLQEHQFWRHLLLLASQIGIDVMYTGMIYMLMCADSQSIAQFLGVSIFYTMRLLTQLTTQLPRPQHYIFDKPFDTPSLVVQHDDIGDYFFSGHCGFSVISYLSYRMRGYRFLSAFSLFQVVFQAFVVLVTNAHYLIDVIAGVAIAILSTNAARHITGKLKSCQIPCNKQE